MPRSAVFLLLTLFVSAGCLGLADEPVEPAARAQPEVPAPEPTHEDPPTAVTTRSAPQEAPEPPAPPAASTGLVFTGERLPAGQAALWTGDGLGQGRPKAGDHCIPFARCEMTWHCENDNCLTRPLEIFQDEGAPAPAVLHASVRWPAKEEPSLLGIQLLDAAGEVLVNGTPGVLGTALTFPNPAPGAYQVRVLHAAGPTLPFEAGAVLTVAPAGPRDRGLLPDLVTLAPTDLRIENPTGGPGPYGLLAGPQWEPLGERGCGPDERVLAAPDIPVRCLRFSNAVGNVGQGPLEVRLEGSEGALAAAAMGQFVQRIHHADGSTTDRPAGAAEFHAIHGHFHNAAANRFSVHPFDPASGARGEALGEGRKTGICFADVGIVHPGLPVETVGYPGLGCIVPDETAHWWLGIQPGWYDLYPWWLSDQYVDLGDASDGTYVVCSITNQDGALAEEDLDNNETCTAFRLIGDQVETLGPRPYHSLP